MTSRRDFLAASAATGALSWTGLTSACPDKLQEEFLELIRPNKRTLLATHAVKVDPSIVGSERFVVSPDARRLAFSRRSDQTFQLLRADGERFSYPAPEGGKAIFNPTNPKTLLLDLRKVGRRELVLVNTNTGQSERWADFIGTRSVAFTPLGIVVAHDRPMQGGGAISLLTGKEEYRELLRVNDAHTLTVSRGAELGYFANNEAFSLDLNNNKPQSYGTVRYPLRAACWHGDGLLGASEMGAYWFRKGHKPIRLLQDRELTQAFNHGPLTVCVSPYALYIWKEPSQAAWIVRARGGNIGEVRPLWGSRDLIMVRGNAAYRVDVDAHKLTLLASGRADASLRSALVFDDAVVAWSVRPYQEKPIPGCP